MKTRFSWLVTGAVSLLPITATLAAEAAATVEATTPAASATVTVATPVKLPYGVDDVVKLCRAQVSEDIVLSYIQNSGTIYNLGSQDIVYLHQQGISDRVVNAMLDQRKRAEVAQAQAAAQTPAPAPAAVDPSVANGTAYTQPTYAPSPTYVQQPVSTAYVIPYPAASAAYYGYPYRYGFYGPYGYYGPSVSFSFGYGGYGCYGGHYYGGHYGGHYGGGHWGGGGHHH